MLSIGYCLSDIFLIRQYGQIVLLTIREAFTLSYYLADKETDISGQTIDLKLSSGRAISINREGLCLFINNLFSLWIDKLYLRLTTNSMISGIKQASTYLRLITHTDKARHIGLYHHILLCDSLTIDIAIHHILGVGNTHKAPSSQALRQSKRYSNLSILISL